MIAYVQNTSSIPFQLSLLLPAASVLLWKLKHFLYQANKL